MDKDWNLTIRGVGPTDNNGDGQDSSKDAEVLIRKFVKDLRAIGHEIRVANFTPGELDLTQEEVQGEPEAGA
jgi:hypothetical protein